MGDYGTLFCDTYLDLQVKLFVQTQQKCMQMYREEDKWTSDVKFSSTKY